MVLPCRMVYASCIAFIFHTKQTFRIAALFRVFRCRNRFWVFLRLWQIDGNIQIPILGIRCPFLVFLNPVSSDIIRILAELVIKIRCLFRSLLIQTPKFADYFAWPWHKHTHNLRIEQIPVNNAVLFHNPFFYGIIHHPSKHFFQFFHRSFLHSIAILYFVQTKKFQQSVYRINLIFFFYQPCL